MDLPYIHTMRDLIFWIYAYVHNKSKLNIVYSKKKAFLIYEIYKSVNAVIMRVYMLVVP